MKIITRLEKSIAFWYLLTISLFFFLLRFPSLIEPYWYGDEGIYQVIGIAVNNGRLLYSQIWDNKPPLLYLVYALFGGDQFSVRFFSLIVGLVTTFVFFSFSQKLFKKTSVSIVTTSLFAILFATPYLEGNIANAENFMLLPILAAGYLVYISSQSLSLRGIHRMTWQSSTRLLHFVRNDSTISKILNTKYLILFLAGLLLGISFLFKIVALFDFAAFFLYVVLSTYPERISLSMLKKKYLLPVFKTVLPLVMGFLLPILFTVLYFAFHHVLSDFIRATFFGNIGYVGYGNKLFIPQGFLIAKLLLLTVFVYFVIRYRKLFPQPVIFILLWFGFSLFNAYFSGRPYTHYALVALPSFCLLIGLFAVAKKPKIRLGLLLFVIGTLLLLVAQFKLYNIQKTFAYYKNTVLFLSGRKDVRSYRSFFDGKTPRDYELSSFINNRTNSQESVFIWGDSAQIYALSHKLPPNKYTVAYHITQSKKGIVETQKALLEVKPKYIIALSEAPPIPFQLLFYSVKFELPGAIIYERTF